MLNKNFITAGLFFLLATFTLGVVYVTEQQILRLGANDPQIQLSEDVANALNYGADPATLLPPTVDIAKSLAPFIVIYDLSGRAQSSSGYLNKTIPVPPAGVFGYTAVNGQNRLTWQPQSGVRLATVITHYQAGFVLAGRNLREVENRESLLLSQIALAELAALILSVMVFLGLTFLNKK